MFEAIWILIGIFLASGLIIFARRSGDYRREKQVYAVGLIVAALIYVGFGLFSGSLGWIALELIGVAVFSFFALLSIRFSGWFLSAGWALHILWDVVLHDGSTNFVPDWYRMLCLGFDLLIAFYSALRVWRMK